MIHEGIPVTRSVRILFDLAGVLSEHLHRRAVREVEVQGLFDHLSLADLLERRPHPPGAELIRSLIGQRAAPATVVPSDGEDRFASLVASGGLPTPMHRYGIALAGDWVEVDFAWPELRVVVEVDSSFHEVDVALELDHLRDQELIAEGWWVFRVTWRQLYHEPERVLARLRRLLTRAGDGRP